MLSLSTGEDTSEHAKFQSGVVVISGLWGLGKSTLAFTAERPDQTAILDFDLKGEQMARDYGIRHYAAPNVVGDNPADYDVKLLAEWFVQQIQAIPDETASLVLDNATWVEAGLGYLVARNPAKYGVREANVQSGRFGGVNPGITKLWANIVSDLQTVKGVKTVFAVNHMSEPWINGVPALNKYVVRGNKVFRRLCICAFILVPPDIQRGGQPPAPSALVAKEALAIRRWDGERYVTQRALPMRIPVADWLHINRYFDQPADLTHPAAGETWNEHELHAYGDWLSGEQVQWALSVQSYEEGAEEVASPQPTIAELKQAWIEEATRVGVIEGAQDVVGLQRIKKVLGSTYESLVPECDTSSIRTEGLAVIGMRKTA